MIGDVLELLKEVITGTLFQQNGKSPIIWQRSQGLLMGGRSSAEIVNLYFYSVESQALDKIKSIYGVAACKIFVPIWCFIDDMSGSEVKLGPFWLWNGAQENKRNTKFSGVSRNEI